MADRTEAMSDSSLMNFAVALELEDPMYSAASSTQPSMGNAVPWAGASTSSGWPLAEVGPDGGTAPRSLQWGGAPLLYSVGDSGVSSMFRDSGHLPQMTPLDSSTSLPLGYAPDYAVPSALFYDPQHAAQLQTQRMQSSMMQSLLRSQPGYDLGNSLGTSLANSMGAPPQQSQPNGLGGSRMGFPMMPYGFGPSFPTSAAPSQYAAVMPHMKPPVQPPTMAVLGAKPQPALGQNGFPLGHHHDAATAAAIAMQVHQNTVAQNQVASAAVLTSSGSSNPLGEARFWKLWTSDEHPLIPETSVDASAANAFADAELSDEEVFPNAPAGPVHASKASTLATLPDASFTAASLPPPTTKEDAEKLKPIRTVAGIPHLPGAEMDASAKERGLLVESYPTIEVWITKVNELSRSYSYYLEKQRKTFQRLAQVADALKKLQALEQRWQRLLQQQRALLAEAESFQRSLALIFPVLSQMHQHEFGLHSMGAHAQVLLSECQTFLRSPSVLDMPPCVGLVVSSDPFPCSLFKDRPIEFGNVTVQVLTGTTASLPRLDKLLVHADVVDVVMPPSMDFGGGGGDEEAAAGYLMGLGGEEDFGGSESSSTSSSRKRGHGEVAKKSRNQKASMDLLKPIPNSGPLSRSNVPEVAVSVFNFKFKAGSRMHPVSFRFSYRGPVMVYGKMHEVNVSTLPTRPVVVTTYQTQWADSARILLLEELFPLDPATSAPRETCPFEFMFNRVQWHFHQALCKDVFQGRGRFLLQEETQYFHARFFDSAALLTRTQFETFWSWFGKTTMRLKYQKHVGAMYHLGYIFPFSAKETASAVLELCDPGTFLIRCSESNPGQFAISFRTNDNARKFGQHLISADELAQSRSLADLLANYRALGGLYVVDLYGRGSVVNKETALQRFYSKKTSGTNTDGYDDDLPLSLSAMTIHPEQTHSSHMSELDPEHETDPDVEE